MPRLPNFFILGAGRCGTTSLYQQLAKHPDIFMSPNKEPTFFCDFFGMKNPWHYLQLFRDSVGEQIVGECSHAYLSCPTSAEMLRAYVPDAKFVVLLRNPADRAYSLYCWMTAAGNEWLAPFETALAAEDRRARDPRFLRKNPQYFYNYLYFRSGLYGKQIRRYSRLFPRNRFLFLRFEDLASDIQGVLQRVCRFIGVDPEFDPGDQSPANRSRSVRSAHCQYFLRRRVESALIKLRLHRMRPLVDRVANWNIAQGRPAPLSAETRRDLIDDYRSDLELIESLTGIDTSLWRQAPSTLAPYRKSADQPKSNLQGSGPYKLR